VGCRARHVGRGAEVEGTAVSASEKYVAAAYLVVFAFVVLYLAIMALKLTRLEREIGELTELARKRTNG
jgi:CcmD family protein